MSPSLSSLYEAFADVTLLFGFLPGAGNISVIGVGWFLGLVFVFYLVFPFFCVLLENKRRAWLAFGISLIYNFVCVNYFEAGRSNILYSGCFFLAGGLIYLYREKLSGLNRWIVLGTAVVSAVLYYIVGGNALMCLLVSVTLLTYAVIHVGGGLENRVTRFFSSISMEIYLSHMMIFRIVEKTGFTKALEDGKLQYIATVAVVLVGAVIFAVVMKKIFGVVEEKISLKSISKISC